MFRNILAIIILLPVLLYGQTEQIIEIGTFNIEWFPCKDDGDKMKEYDINLSNPPEGQATDVEALFTLLKDLDIELIGVLEIVDPQFLEESAQKYLGTQYKLVYSPSGGGSQKIGFLYDSSVLQVIGNPQVYMDVALKPSSWLRPAFRVYFKVIPNGFDFNAVVTHLKAYPSGWKKRQKQWKVLESILKTIPQETNDKDIILLGDFNNVSKHGFDEFKPVINRLNYFWATSELKNKWTSYWMPNRSEERIQGSLIDHIFISEDAKIEYIENSLKAGGMCCDGKYEYEGDEIPDYYEKISDHCPVYGSFKADVDND